MPIVRAPEIPPGAERYKQLFEGLNMTVIIGAFIFRPENTGQMEALHREESPVHNSID